MNKLEQYKSHICPFPTDKKYSFLRFNVALISGYDLDRSIIIIEEEEKIFFRVFTVRFHLLQYPNKKTCRECCNSSAHFAKRI
jgi:hypothetical protein